MKENKNYKWNPIFGVGDFIECSDFPNRTLFIIGISTSSNFYFCLNKSSVIIIIHKVEDRCKKVNDNYDEIWIDEDTLTNKGKDYEYFVDDSNDL